METENSLVLREAAKDAKMAYFNHLAGGGKRDPAQERWIEAMSAGADAITRASVLESRLKQVERERDALLNDLQTAIYRGRSFNLDCEFCKDKAKPICEGCNWEWRGVCPENTKEKETLQEEETK